jgi:hypothetical protein
MARGNNKNKTTKEKVEVKSEATPVAKKEKKEAQVSLKERYKVIFNERKSAQLKKECTGEPNMDGVEGDPALQKYFDKYNSL